MKRKMFYACDYRGVDLKEQLIANHKKTQYSALFELEDLGITANSPLDYVDISKKLANAMRTYPDAIGIIVCGSGQGVAIALNRFTHIRAVVCRAETDAFDTREKLDANILCLGNKYTSLETAIGIITRFVNTPFKEQKHGICAEKLKAAQTSHFASGVNLIVRAIIEHEDHILLTKVTPENTEFSSNVFFLPGGHVDHNEQTTSALIREIWEEMRLEIKSMQFSGILECSWQRNNSIYHEINVVYKVKIDDLSLSEPPKSFDHNFQTFVWVSIKDINNIDILPRTLKQIIIEKVVEKNTSVATFLSEMLQENFNVSISCRTS